MSSTTHTPGPWRQGQAGDIGYSDAVAPCHIWTSKGPGCGMVATTSPWWQPEEQNRIDARLIAAAPDLLAALKRVLAVADRKTDEFDAARAAIVKATGAAP